MTRYKKEIHNINTHMLDCSYKELQDYRLKKEWMKSCINYKLKSFYDIKYMLNDNSIIFAKYSRLYIYPIDDDLHVYLELKCEASTIPRIAISISSKGMPDIVHTIQMNTMTKCKAIVRYIRMLCTNNDIDIEIWDDNNWMHLSEISDINELD